MSRIGPVDLETTNDGLAATFASIQKQLGTVPNMMRTMAQSPSVLQGYLSFASALRGGRLSAHVQAQLAMAVAQTNACDYCLSAHTALGRRAGVSDDELTASRDGHSRDGKTAAALEFALAIIAHRGDVGDQDLARVRAAGFGDDEVAEIIAHVALNIFTNYFNRTARTEIDFPRVTAAQPASR